MKKGILLAVGLLFVLAGCGTDQAKDVSSKSTDTIVTKTSKTGSTTTKESEKNKKTNPNNKKIKNKTTDIKPNITHHTT
ncbi:hypothetical protein K2D_23950 [Enterococcus hirae]|uniref:hypothetical protein n=1 Tax=Enterococcus hirae TaxID=1354 RepID=UPI00244D82AE|nr:hypothetical protein [Enterococcus hirae]GMB99335.1 hypothetical protein K2D_23950 [Enterococcus hirae]